MTCHQTPRLWLCGFKVIPVTSLSGTVTVAFFSLQPHRWTAVRPLHFKYGATAEYCSPISHLGSISLRSTRNHLSFWLDKWNPPNFWAASSHSEHKHINQPAWMNTEKCRTELNGSVQWMSYRYHICHWCLILHFWPTLGQYLIWDDLLFSLPYTCDKNQYPLV